MDKGQWWEVENGGGSRFGEILPCTARLPCPRVFGAGGGSRESFGSEAGRKIKHTNPS